MLILTRKVGQGFTVGDGVTITITELSGDKVKVGIDAPRDVKILRTELQETMEQNKQAATAANLDGLRSRVKLARQKDSVRVNKAGLEPEGTAQKEPEKKPEGNE